MLSKEATTIGRAESCDIGLFRDNAIERLHARILLQNNRYVLSDEDSQAGTYVNDQRVSRPTPLKNGDRIRVGGCELRFGERQKRN
jgi:pSer/pThr/pTyr-binding forkhead associated (FHA) protein